MVVQCKKCVKEGKRGATKDPCIYAYNQRVGRTMAYVNTFYRHISFYYVNPYRFILTLFCVPPYCSLTSWQGSTSLLHILGGTKGALAREKNKSTY